MHKIYKQNLAEEDLINIIRILYDQMDFVTHLSGKVEK
jgi:plasmid stabilization system protein ParE